MLAAMDVDHTTFTLGVAAACVAGTVAVMKLMGGSSAPPAAARVEDTSVCLHLETHLCLSRPPCSPDHRCEMYLMWHGGGGGGGGV